MDIIKENDITLTIIICLVVLVIICIYYCTKKDDVNYVIVNNKKDDKLLDNGMIMSNRDLNTKIHHETDKDLYENNEFAKGKFIMKKNIPYLGLSDDLLNEELLPNGDLFII